VKMSSSRALSVSNMPLGYEHLYLQDLR
jgi:hypothetical protein